MSSCGSAWMRRGEQASVETPGDNQKRVLAGSLHWRTGRLVETVGQDETSSRDARSVVGTPLYLSPEAITMPETVDPRSDLYALGAVGYFLLTGVPPFSGQNVVEVCARHLSETPRPPSERRAGIGPELDAMVLRCLEKSPTNRPESAAALRLELLALSAEWTEERAASWWAERNARGAAIAA